MDHHAHQSDDDISRGQSAPGDPGSQLPTSRKVLTRALWACLVQVAGVPLLAWWLFDTSTGQVTVPWWPVVVFLVYVLLVPWAHRLLRAPRSSLEDQADQQIDWQRANRALLIVAETGTLSPDREAHTAAGVLACRDIESPVWRFAYTVGLFIAALVVPSWGRLVLGAFIAVIAATEIREARRGWRYLKVVHTTAHTL